MRRTVLILSIVALLALLFFGFFFRAPKPEIEIAAEDIFSIGPIDITNSIITAWIVVVLLIVFAWFATRNLKEIPSGLQNLVEAGFEAFLGLVENVAGPKNGRKFFPLVATILIYVMISNWFGLLPGVGTIGKFHESTHGAVAEDVGVTMIWPSPDEVEEGDVYYAADGTLVVAHEEEEDEEGAAESEPVAAEDEEDAVRLDEGQRLGWVVPFLRGVNADLNATAAIAITAVFFVQVWGFQALGFRGYGSKFFNVGKLRQGKLFDGFIDLIVGFLEIVSEFARIISFTFRLFGNIFAGEVLLLIISFLAPFVLILPFYGLELFVGFIQAFVFAMLTLVFGVMAVAGHGDHAEHEAEVLHPPLTGTGPHGEHP